MLVDDVVRLEVDKRRLDVPRDSLELNRTGFKAIVISIELRKPNRITTD